jgi:2-C-methyl-D-erythritol 2,4-cyclodiphosphate synthase
LKNSFFRYKIWFEVKIMKCAIGQDSHRFSDDIDRKLILGGIEITGHKGLKGNSDADVILHALINAVSGITGVNILGEKADLMCLEKGITDSSMYLREALKFLDGGRISHVSFTIECLTPRLSQYIPSIKDSIASLLGIGCSNVGITATSGEGLTAFGRGEGIMCFCILTVV